ncbi:hypothetical protein [uncultured Pelagimonas sp.]|uniref:hypothetical protein n=1 Tax=uncultured Pelagimonas sp. TaxID=1618102 RepID=UPI00262C0DE5|nr:hypothetical protein [uncultured Pelagimonas sp.]
MRDLRRHQRPSDAPVFDSGLNVMFLAAFPLVLWIFQGSLSGVATALLEMGLFSVALRLISRGQELQRAYDLAQVATAPKLPRKVIGSALIGIVVFILAGHHFPTLVAPSFVGLVAMGLSLTAFGVDPLADKGADNPELLNRIAAEHAWDQADDSLSQITDRIAHLDDADLTLKADATRAMVMGLMRSFGTDPRDLARISKLVTKFTDILRAETDRLETSWHEDNYLFARKRFILKLDVLSESFETHAREGSQRSGRDAFDLEADLLLDRMPRESAA